MNSGALVARLWPYAVLIALSLLWITRSAGVFGADGGANLAEFSAWQPVSWAHPFGTNQLGQDCFARWIAALGAVVTQIAPAVVCGISVAVILGWLSAWYAERALDHCISLLLSLLEGIPGFVLVVSLIAIAGSGTLTSALILALLVVPSAARQVRSYAGQALAAHHFIAVQALGAGLGTQLFGNLWPLQKPLIWALLFNATSECLKVQLLLGFLGLSAGTAGVGVSLGALLHEGVDAVWAGRPLILVTAFASTAVILFALESLSGRAYRLRWG